MNAMRVRTIPILLAGVVAAVAALAACAGSDSTSTPARSSTTRRPGASSTSTTAALATTTSTGSRPPAAAVPGTVTVVQAGPAGGSGEIQVSWSAVAGALGYRVGRAAAASGPFATTADVDAATGEGPHHQDVVNLYRSGAGYVYVDVPTGGAERRRYYRVTAYNASGAATPSVVVCGAPVGSTC